MHAMLVRLKIRCTYLWWRIRFKLAPAAIPKNKDGKVYLNLGCGVNTSGEFINIDAIPFRHTHIVANIQDLGMFPDNSVDLIYASHVIEHIPRNHLERTLREWNRVLKPGGVLRFGVPNFDSLIEIYRRNGNDTDSIVNQLLGQDGEYDDHHTIWNTKYAEKILTQTGFTDVKPWDPKTATPRGFSDKSDRVYTDSAGEVPISLNLEATKA